MRPTSAVKNRGFAVAGQGQGIAIERLRPKGLRRCRMAILRDLSSESLRTLRVDNIEEGATVITDGLPPYQPATAGLYTHRR